jgi:hypothetical protein
VPSVISRHFFSTARTQIRAGAAIEKIERGLKSVKLRPRPAKAAHPNERIVFQMDDSTQIKPNGDEPLLTFRQVVKMLHSSHRRLKKAHEAGQFEAILIGKRWAIPRREALRLLSEQGK